MKTKESKMEKYLEFLWKDTHEVRERLFDEAGRDLKKARENTRKWFEKYRKTHPNLKIAAPPGWKPKKLKIPKS